MGLTRPDGPDGPEGDVAGRADPPPRAVLRPRSAAGLSCSYVEKLLRRGFFASAIISYKGPVRTLFLVRICVVRSARARWDT